MSGEDLSTLARGARGQFPTSIETPSPSPEPKSTAHLTKVGLCNENFLGDLDGHSRMTNKMSPASGLAGAGAAMLPCCCISMRAGPWYS